MTTTASTSAPREPGPEPEPDQVSGPDTSVMDGLTLHYTYSGGRHHRLLFDHHHHVTFEMPDLGLHADAPGPGPGGGPSKAPVLTYQARELKPGLVLCTGSSNGRRFTWR